MAAIDVHVMNERQVLVVAGDYEIVQQVRSALSGRGFVVQSAYSHRDAAHSMRQGRHDLVVVDAAMRDRQSGTGTLNMLWEQKLRPPLVAIALNGNEADAVRSADTVVTTLDDISIRRGVMQALKMPAMQLVELPKADDQPVREEGRRRGEEVQTLLALGRSLTEVLNLNEVLNRVVEAARRLTNAEEGMILLPDKETGQLWLRAKVGIDVEVARNFRVKTHDTIAGAVFKSAKPLLIAEQGPQKVKTEYFVNSLLYVPILLRGKSMGVLGVNNKHKDDVFDNRHQELLVNLASYAAIAIENARIHEESVKQARELKALVDGSQIINSSVALERTLPNICEQFVRVLNVSRAEIFDWDGDTQQLRTLSRFYRTAWRAGTEPTMPLSAYPALANAFAQNRPIMVARGEAALPAIAQDAGAVLLVPILATNAAIGAMQVYYVRPPAETPPEDAIHRAQRLVLQCLAQLSDSSGQNAASVFRLADEANRALGADWCEIVMMSSDRQSLHLRLAVGRAFWLSQQPTLKTAPFPHLRDALLGQEVFQYQWGSEGLPEGAKVLLESMRARAVLGVPLLSRGKTTGLALFIDSERASPFTLHEVDLARAISGHATAALENARLVHDLEASLRELKETQSRLIQTARLSAMGEMAAAVAHQVNNPLTTIVLDAELMLLNETPESPRHEALMAIQRAGKRAASVVRRLLTAARSTDIDAKLEPVDVANTVDEVVSLVKAHIERDRVKLIEKLPATELPKVMATPGHLDDVWLNLLLNAHDALTGRPNAAMGIEVNYEPDADMLDVAVWDNGPGIPPEIVDEIFKPFFTTKPVGEGTGLGLHICRQVVERCGGSIEVQSASDQGTRFLVRLPVKRGE